MDANKFEPLLIDYALGGTTPEVAALVEAYQEKDSQTAARMEQWRAVANLARRAIAENEPAPLPAFPLRKLERARRTANRRSMVVWATALAASLMMGFFAGRQFDEQRSAISAANDVPVAAVSDFWSLARLREIAKHDAQPIKSAPHSPNDLQSLFHRYGG